MPAAEAADSVFASVTALTTSARWIFTPRGASNPMRTPSPRTSMTVTTMSSPIMTRSPFLRVSTSITAA